ncbi:hypothetical protein GOARA_064_00970 [Gordonia araii NBRC 100433]|uniref:FHA domain-containing protein n=1 Tax=Gordonia araii NBRC 100433 TaxID=1073574 RepID=G7H5H0_9ACTN|nr:hypothetical protein [Gordonia araii]NNG95809.1 hypothetical protein [Gordonia araii NBRC 100433]GAB11095.1 hypothetical protein GOARA_064_00970 [Gordonia araii NBRC 100433]
MPDSSADLYVEYCGERFDIDPTDRFTVGREGDLALDDNLFLHRRFLLIHRGARDLWYLSNVGSHLSAKVVAPEAGFSGQIAPGATLPLVFGRSVVVFTAGPTTYEFEIHASPGEAAATVTDATQTGDTTVGVPTLTESQRLLIVVLAEQILRREGSGTSAIPSSAQAAARLGWSLTKFNRKLDNVCDKLDQMGVPGMRAGGGKLATNRRARLVEFALASQIVSRADLPLLDAEAERNKQQHDGS